MHFAGDLIEVRYAESADDVPTGSLVTTTVVEVEAPRRSLPRRPIEIRPLAYTLFSLAVHATVLWLAAREALPPLPSVTTESTGHRARIGTFSQSAQTVNRAAKPPPAEVPIAPAIAPPPSPPPARGRGKPAIADSVPHHFDPAANADFDTIRTGSFATLATGRTTGEHYGVDAERSRLVVVSCDETTCLVVGGEAEAGPIRKVVERHLAEITACYRNHAGKVEVDFGLDAAGKVDGLVVGGDRDHCIADVIHAIEFD